jgi:hypothetical protein
MGVVALLCLGALVVAGGAATQGGFGPGSGWAGALEWRPGMGASQPWRGWSAAWVHWSAAHLAANVLGAGVLGFVGWRARMPRSAALAWLVAWPLTHALMDLPAATTVARTLQHYGGLSGVLHAGAIVLGLALLRTRADADAGPPPAARTDEPATPYQSTMAPPRTEGPWAMTSMEELSAWHRLDEASAGPAPLSDAQAIRHRRVGAAIVAGTLAKVLLEAPWDLALRPNALLGIEVAPLAHGCGVAAGAIASLGLACWQAIGQRRRAP